MAGISSKALAFGDPDNKKKYNGIEKENDLQIEIYDAPLRELDGQIGSWWQIDPKTENMEMWSPYVSNYDNPLRYSDPLGDEGQQCCTELWNDIKDAAKETWSSIKSGASDVKNFSVDFYKNGVLPGLDFLNETINPLVPAAETISGKSYSSNFSQSKPRLESATDLALFLVPEAKVEGVIAKGLEKQVVKKIDRDAIQRGVNNERKVLAEEGLTKNTKATTVVDPKTGKQVTTIPDAITKNGGTVDVKDVKTLSDSKQLRAQSVISNQSGQKATVITGTNTKVSQTVQQRMNVIRKDHIGPGK